MPLRTTLKILAEAVQTGTAGLASASGTVPLNREYKLADGSGAQQANRMYSAQLTIGASSQQDLDLAGTLTDIFGAVLTFARIKAIIAVAAVGNTNAVVIGNHPTAAFVGPFGAAAHTVAAKPGGTVALICDDATGWVVTATSADMLRIANGGAGTPVTVDILIIGASA